MLQRGPLMDIHMEEVWKKCIQKNKSLVLFKVACKGLYKHIVTAHGHADKAGDLSTGY